MTLAIPDNIRSLLPKLAGNKGTKPPAKPPATTVPKSTYQSNLTAHFSMANDGLGRIRHHQDIDRLIEILSLNRCAKGPGIAVLLQAYLTTGFSKDDYGNRFLLIPQEDGSAPRIAYTSHCDTMSSDRTALYHPLKYNAEKDVLFRTDGNCLGADDGTGIWIMLGMIDAHVPGLYCFFLDEETGRQGSEWSYSKESRRYAFIDTVISLDRKGTSDIIAKQRGDRCCSIEFQQKLADLLSSDALGLKYHPGALGSFTDSATFMDEIPECTNISVGYDKQHTAQETQLVDHVAKLRRTLMLVGHLFHERLPVKRNPEDDIYVPPAYNLGYGGYGGYGGGYKPPVPKPKSAEQARYDAELEAMAAANGWDISIPREQDDTDDDVRYAASYLSDDDWEALCMVTSPHERLTLMHGDMLDLIHEFQDEIATLLHEQGYMNEECSEYMTEHHPKVVAELLEHSTWTDDELAETLALELFGIENIRNADTYETN